MKDPLVKKYGVSRNGHSLFAPSSAAMWLNCAGSLLVNAVAEDTAGEDAARGTVAHMVAEIWNRTGEKPEHLLGKTEVTSAGGRDWHILIDEEMMAHVENFVNWCRELPGDHYFEQRVDLSEIMPIPTFGTADHFACQPGILTISDLKYGTGVRVYAERNPQAMLYALGVFLRYDLIYDFQTIVIRICQPRLDVYETWTCSRAELLEFKEFARQRAYAAWVENAPRKPSPKACLWCAAKMDCPARIRELDALVDETFDDLDETARPAHEYTDAELKTKALPKQETWDKLHDDIKPLSTKALAFTYTYRRHVEKWFKSIGEELLARAEKGDTIPYFKLTDGRVTRKWKNTHEALKLLRTKFKIGEDQVMPPTMISVAQVEKLIKAETKGLSKAQIEDALSSVVDRFAGKRTLAPLRDERPDVGDLVDETFETEEVE